MLKKIFISSLLLIFVANVYANNAEKNYLILLSNEAAIHNNYKSMAQLNEKLYKYTKYDEYLKLAVFGYLNINKYHKVISLVNANIKYIKDKDMRSNLLSFMIISLANTKKITIQEAIDRLKKLRPRNKNVLTTLYLTYMYEGNRKQAYITAKELFNSENNLRYLQFMANSYTNVNNIITVLRVEEQKAGNTKALLGILSIELFVYQKEKNNDAFLTTLQRVYLINRNPDILKTLLKYYMARKDSTPLKKYFIKNSLNDELLTLYKLNGRNKEALNLAERLFAKSGDYKYLGFIVISKYENSKHKKKMLHYAIKNLKIVNEHSNYGLFLNYLGYIMINNNVDVKSGIKYVKRALSDSSRSILGVNSKEYYYDSLAWGYYKIGKCKEANRIMNKVYRKLNNPSDPQVKILKYHKNKIMKCLRK